MHRYLTILTLMTGDLYGYTHNRPVPTIPQNLNLYSSVDVFSASALRQMHETLFVMEMNRPKPNLVEDFHVEREGRLYRFKLKLENFHDGSQLFASDVQRSLQLAIKLKLPGSEKLSSIVGYEPFLKGEVQSITGIQAIDTRQVVIELERPDNQLLKNLSDFRLSIVKPDPSNDKVQLGLGRYRLTAKTTNSYTLKAFKAVDARAPTEIVFTQEDYKSALKKFREGIYHDLFAYQVEAIDVDSLQAHASIQKAYAPRTYMVALHSGRLRQLKIRRNLSRFIRDMKIAEVCYQQTSNVNILPKGFMGYLSTYQEPKTDYNKLPKTLRIEVANGIGHEHCVVELMQKEFASRGVELDIRVVSTDHMSKSWRDKTIDAFVAYVESEESLDFFQFFVPNNVFQLGLQTDVKIRVLIDKLHASRSQEAKLQGAKNLSKYVLSLNTVVALFHPEQNLVFAQHYEPIQSLFQGASSLRFSRLRKRLL